MEYVNNIGALITMGMGFLGLLFPLRAASFVGLQPVTDAGKSEFRATFGGLFVAAGGCALVMQLPSTFLLLGSLWIGAAIGRIVSIVLDKVGDKKNWQAVIFESVIGLMLIIG